eukprot:TRINITY_DN5529_c0_g1_i1.p1 TRINITY_DN5529_c0_g1~~TRINITY_DN5529_c0_g1_i1.p1  ORF type:complete len:216 (+),score=33.65 TRINITY_DN5529_c0_g1_i1:589-1236(+)
MRYALTIWLTRDESHNEDQKLIRGGIDMLRQISVPKSLSDGKEKSDATCNAARHVTTPNTSSTCNTTSNTSDKVSTHEIRNDMAACDTKSNTTCDMTPCNATCATTCDICCISDFNQRKLNQLSIEQVEYRRNSNTGIKLVMQRQQFHIPFTLSSEEELIDFLSFWKWKKGSVVEGPEEEFWSTLHRHWITYKARYVEQITSKIDKWVQVNQLCD